MDGHHAFDLDQVTNGCYSSYAQGTVKSEYNVSNQITSQDSSAASINGSDRTAGLNDGNIFQFSGISASPNIQHDQVFVSPYQSSSTLQARLKRTQRDRQNYQSPTLYRGSPVGVQNATTSSRGPPVDVYHTPSNCSSRVQPVDDYSNYASTSSRDQSVNMYHTPTSHRGQSNDVYYTNNTPTMVDTYHTSTSSHGQPVDAYYAPNSSRRQPVDAYSDGTSTSAWGQTADGYQTPTSSRGQHGNAYSNSASKYARGMNAYSNSGSPSAQVLLVDDFNTNCAPTSSCSQRVDMYQTPTSGCRQPGDVYQTSTSFHNQILDASFNTNACGYQPPKSTNRVALKVLDNYQRMQSTDGSTYYDLGGDSNITNTNFVSYPPSVSADSRPSCQYQRPSPQETLSFGGFDPNHPSFNDVSESHIAIQDIDNKSGLLKIEMTTDYNNSVDRQIDEITEENRSAYRACQQQLQQQQQQQQQQWQLPSQSDYNKSNTIEHNAQSLTFDQNYQEDPRHFYESTESNYFFGSSMLQPKNEVYTSMSAATYQHPATSSSLYMSAATNQHQATRSSLDMSAATNQYQASPSQDESGRPLMSASTGAVSNQSLQMRQYISKNSASTNRNSESSNDSTNPAFLGAPSNLADVFNPDLAGSFQECVVCKVSFMTKAALSSHMRSHKENRLYECTQCTQSFRHRSTLAHHLLTHTGVKQFQCPICAKSFTLKYNMTRHMKKMHK